MSKIGAFEAKTHFSALLERAHQGEEIIITMRGEPFAKLGPLGSGHDVNLALAAADRIRQTSKRISQNKITMEEIRNWVNEGRPSS